MLADARNRGADDAATVRTSVASKPEANTAGEVMPRRTARRQGLAPSVRVPKIVRAPMRSP